MEELFSFRTGWSAVRWWTNLKRLFGQIVLAIYKLIIFIFVEVFGPTSHFILNFGLLVVSISAILVFFHRFSYNGVYFHHNREHCTPYYCLILHHSWSKTIHFFKSKLPWPLLTFYFVPNTCFFISNTIIFNHSISDFFLTSGQMESNYSCGITSNTLLCVETCIE